MRLDSLCFSFLYHTWAEWPVGSKTGAKDSEFRKSRSLSESRGKYSACLLTIDSHVPGYIIRFNRMHPLATLNPRLLMLADSFKPSWLVLPGGEIESENACN